MLWIAAISAVVASIVTYCTADLPQHGRSTLTSWAEASEAPAVAAIMGTPWSGSPGHASTSVGMPSSSLNTSLGSEPARLGRMVGACPQLWVMEAAAHCTQGWSTASRVAAQAMPTCTSSGGQSTTLDGISTLPQSSSSTTTNFTVAKRDSSTTVLDVRPEVLSEGEDVSVDVSVSPVPTGGTVQLALDGTDVGSPIALDSEVGVGSTFRFTLGFERGPQLPLSVPDLAGLDVLIVDDNETSRAALCGTACAAIVQRTPPSGLEVERPASRSDQPPGIFNEKPWAASATSRVSAASAGAADSKAAARAKGAASLSFMAATVIHVRRCLRDEKIESRPDSAC